MSHAEHEWAKEQMAAHLAGGLPADERARLEAHVAGCAECIAEIDAARRFERQMDDLFTPVRPKAGIEERMIRALRAEPARRARPFVARAALALAATFLVAVAGIVVLGMYENAAAARDEGRAVAAVYADGAAVFAVAKDDATRLPGADELAKERAGEQLALLDGKESDQLHAELRGPGSARWGYLPDDAVDKASGGVAGGGAGNKIMPRKAGGKDYAPAASRENASRDTYLWYNNAGPAGNVARVEEALEKAPSQDPAAPDVARRPPAPKGEAARNQQAQAQAQPGAVQEPPPPPVQRKIIRSGEMEFEIEAFDSAVATLTKIAAEEQGFVATVNSEKLPNGKVRGTVVVRCPPERLDTLLLKLRALGELKSQRIGSQDVTKHYTDLESQLRAARAMEERLLKIIKEGKGEIKDLLQAEKELGHWRIKIETLEGEIRYYNSLISLSTLSITLFEKEIRSPSGLTETERVQMGIEVEDVEKAYKEAVAAVTEAKGRITHSELKQTGPGRQQALLRFEVDPEKSGALRDRLKQLGVVARQDVNIHTQTEGGTGRAQEVKVRRNDTQFDLSIYNLANVNPREAVHVKVAAADAEAAFKAILARAEKAGAPVLSSNLNRQRSEQTQGTITFDVKTAEAEAVEADVKAQGEVFFLQRVENPDAQTSTRSKKRFVCEVWALGAVHPRETTAVQIAAKDVAATYHALLEAVKKAEARILTANLNENDRQNVTATLEFDVRRANEPAVAAALKAAGDVVSRSSTRIAGVEHVVDLLTRLSVTLTNVANLPARETVRLGVEAANVDRAVARVEAIAAEAKGRVVDANHTREASGRHVSRMILTVPFGSVRTVEAAVKELGTVRVAEAAKNPQVPEGELAIARLDVTLSNVVLLSADSGPWANIKKGLTVSAYAGSMALMVIMVGVCFVLPVALVAWAGVRLVRKARAKPAAGA
jgi:hypothetical protein